MRLYQLGGNQMKRALAVLLVLAIVLSFAVMPVSATTAITTNTTQQEENVTPVTDACPCGCGKKVEEIEWTPIPTNLKGSPAEGHHYLTQDFYQGDYGMTVIAGTNVVIDLRGYTWGSTSNKNRLFTVQGNLTIMDTVGGGKIAPKIRGAWGGAFLLDTYETANPTLILASGTLTTAASGNGEPSCAGFIYAMEDSRFIMKGGVIENISVPENGGVIHTSGTATVELLGGIIRNCSAGKQGGVVNSVQPVTLKDTTFINCTAGTDGGVVRSSKKITVEGCTFMNCSAAGNGGAIYAPAGLSVKDSLFIGNTATTSGSDIYVTGTTAAKVENSTFYGGHATVNGGAIMASDANLTIENSLMMGAIADKQGGHIYQYGGSLTIKNCEMTGGISNWAGSGTPYCGGGNLLVMAGKSAATTVIEDSLIRNGFAMARGGNIQLCSDTTTFTMKNTTVTGGVAKYRGNNLEAQSSMTITLDGCVIDGDVALTGNTKPITLKGELKIGLRNNGLALGANAKVDASGLTEGSEIYLSGTGDLVAAGANPDYFKGAIRTKLAGGNDAVITGTSGNTGYCPHCGAIVTWGAFQDLGESTASGHYYLTDSISSNTNCTYNGVDVVLDLNGKTLADTSGRALTTRVVNGACTVSILDSVGNGMLKSKGPGSTANGGVIFNNGTVKIYGGNFTNTSKGSAGKGGIIYNSGTLYIYGGFFDGSNYENTSSTYGLGGVLCTPGGKKTTITAGHFVGGSAYTGGNLYISTTTTTNISGGTFVNGTAASTSGNLYFADTTGSCQVSNAVIRGGTATTSAGNIRLGKYTTVNTFDHCYIGDGSATGSGAYGGNISLTSSNATVTDCVIYGGSSASLGGNLYTAGTGGAATFDSCLITGGTATNNGGNIMFNHGNHIIKGGEISYGSARIGGNMYAHAGNHASGGSATFQKNADGDVPKIFGGSASYGGNLSVVGTVDLRAAEIFSGEVSVAGADIQLVRLSDAEADPKLTVGSDVTGGRTGKISMVASVPEPVYGQTVTYTVCNGLNETTTIILENADGQPKVLAKDGVLKVAGAKAVDAEGNTVWYTDFNEAADAVAAQGGIVKLYADTELNLTQDTFVDLNGHTATVTGEGKLLGLDTTGDDYSLPTGKLTFEGESPVADKSVVYAPNGNKYVALVGDGEVTFHRLGADLTSVTINIDKNAVYFKGKFGADEKLKPLIDTYGIAVSLKGMPDATMTDAHASTYAGENLVNGETASGVYVTNILKQSLTAEENNARGRSKIYATAYVTLEGNVTLLSDQTATSEDDVAWSLYDAFRRLDQLIDEDPSNFRRHTNAMRAYYEKWKDLGIRDWIDTGSNFVDPEDDGVIDVLMIGSSACYYYVEEMASLAEAAGVKLRVCNVYYSGCPINKYYQDWLNNYADYQFFDTTAETLPDGTIKATRKALGGGKTLEWCLAQGDWDVISMQTRGALAMRDYFTGVDHLEASDIKEASEFMFRYVKSQFPDAHFYLKEFWASQAGKNGTYGGTYYPMEGLAQQTLYTTVLKDAADRMAVKFSDIDMRVMRDGEAWQLVREAGYDQLCARLGFRPDADDTSFDTSDPHEGDHGHDGDIGGGQYLNGALWLQTIMQNHYDANFDVRKIDWVPTYTYSNKVVENRFDAKLLKECAYKAAKGTWQLPADFVSPAK